MNTYIQQPYYYYPKRYWPYFFELELVIPRYIVTKEKVEYSSVLEVRRCIVTKDKVNCSSILSTPKIVSTKKLVVKSSVLIIK